MARIFGDSLRLIDRLYQFAAGARSAPTEFSTESPIQPVFDTSRISQLGAVTVDPRAGGYVQIGQDNVHAAGGETVEATISPYTDGTLGILNPEQVWIWLIQRAGSASGTTIMGANSEAQLTMGVAKLGSALARRDYALQRWSTAVLVATDLSATFPAALSTSQATAAMQVNAFGPTWPILLPPGSVLTWRTTATAAVPGTIRVSIIAQVTPIGVYPPGLM